MKPQALAASFILFVALCASVAYWGMQLFKPPVRPVAAPHEVKPEIHPEAVSMIFGGRPPSTAVASNYQLKGVVVSGTPDESVAILETMGKPPKAVAVNAEVTSGVVVKEVHPKYVILTEGGVAKRVELPATAGAQALGQSPQSGYPVAEAAPLQQGNPDQGGNQGSDQVRTEEQPPPPPPPENQAQTAPPMRGMGMGMSMQRH
jgi:general secretion pathway protein C